MAAHLLSRRLKRVVNRAVELTQVLVEGAVGPGIVLRREELLVRADGLAGDEIPGHRPRGLSILANGPQEESALDDVRDDLGGDGRLLVPGVGEGILPGSCEMPQVLAVAGEEGVGHPGVLQGQLDVASSQLVFISRGQLQWLVVSPVGGCQRARRAALGWSI